MGFGCSPSDWWVAVALIFTFTGSKGHQTYDARVGVEELKCPAMTPDLNPTQHLWDKQKHELQPRPPPLIDPP